MYISLRAASLWIYYTNTTLSCPPEAHLSPRWLEISGAKLSLESHTQGPNSFQTGVSGAAGTCPIPRPPLSPPPDPVLSCTFSTLPALLGHLVSCDVFISFGTSLAGGTSSRGEAGCVAIHTPVFLAKTRSLSGRPAAGWGGTQARFFFVLFSRFQFLEKLTFLVIFCIFFPPSIFGFLLERILIMKECSCFAPPPKTKNLAIFWHFCIFLSTKCYYFMQNENFSQVEPKVLSSGKSVHPVRARKGFYM